MIDGMRTFVKAPDANVPVQPGYGLGVRERVVDGQRLVGHTGTIPDYSALARHRDDLEYTIAVLSDVSSVDQAHVFSRLWQTTQENFY